MVDIYELLRRDQNGTAEYVKSFLDDLNIKYVEDGYGNIFNVEHENAPLLSAHMDTVRDDEDFVFSAFLTEDDSDKISSGGVLGGDDKCGVGIILNVLETGRKVNFIFSRDEETGCKGINFFAKDKNNTDAIKNNCLYCLVLDRRGNSDIICDKNDYGTKEFENALVKVSDDNNFGYKPTQGLCSDANTIRDYISTANLSVGYFSPHSSSEYIVKADYKKALDYTIAIIDTLTDKFVAAEKRYYDYSKYYSSGNTNSYYGDYYNDWKYWLDYDDEYDYDYYSEVSKHYGEGEKKAITFNPNKNQNLYCHFCGLYERSESEIFKIKMPDGEEFNICSLCVEDLESELKRIRLEQYNSV